MDWDPVPRQAWDVWGAPHPSPLPHRHARHLLASRYAAAAARLRAHRGDATRTKNNESGITA